MLVVETQLARQLHQCRGGLRQSNTVVPIRAEECVGVGDVPDRRILDKALSPLLRLEKGASPSLEQCRLLLKGCVKTKSVSAVKQLHTHLVKNGFATQRALSESFVDTLVKCGGLSDALDVFSSLTHRTVLSYTAIIYGFVSAGQCKEALRMYKQMQQERVNPDRFTFVSLLRACGVLGDLNDGKRLHHEVIKYSCQFDLYVGTALVDMYLKCGSLVDAVEVFESLAHRDVVSWTAIIGGCSKNHPEQAFRLYAEMRNSKVEPDARIFMSMIQACKCLAEKEEDVLLHGIHVKADTLQKGKFFFAEALRAHASDGFLLNTMDMLSTVHAWLCNFMTRCCTNLLCQTTEHL